MLSHSNNAPEFWGRIAFLNAATAVMKPAPLVTLQEVVPLFAPWFQFERGDQADPSLSSWFELRALLRCRISTLDNSALRKSVFGWMDRHGFDRRDEWIADAALLSLGWSVVKGCSLAWSLYPARTRGPSLRHQ
jgi:hypothetical protein